MLPPWSKMVAGALKVLPPSEECAMTSACATPELGEMSHPT